MTQRRSPRVSHLVPISFRSRRVLSTSVLSTCLGCPRCISTIFPFALCLLSAHHPNALCPSLGRPFRYSSRQSGPISDTSPLTSSLLSARRRARPRVLVLNASSPPSDSSDFLTSRCCRSLVLSSVSGYASLYYEVHDPSVLWHRAFDIFLSRVSVSLFIAPVPFVSFHFLSPLCVS